MSEVIIIDGYNLLGAVNYDFKASLESRRDWLIAQLNAYATGNERVILVFDSPKGKSSKTKTGNIEIVYAAKPGGADSYIEKMVATQKQARIVTADNAVLNASTKKGITRWRPQQFWNEWRELDMESHTGNRRVDIEERLRAKNTSPGKPHRKS